MSKVTTVDIERYFFTDGAFIPDPPNSLYYTVGTASEIASGTYAGLYDTGTLNESTVPGLYDIPLSGRRITTDNLIDYSISEDGTTLNPNNLQGGSGQVTITTIGVDRPQEFFTASTYIRDDIHGRVDGVIRDFNASNNDIVQFTADTLTALFNVETVFKPMSATLRTILVNYISVLDLNIAIDFEDSLGTRAVTYPGYVGNAWDCFKQIGAAEQIEFAFLNNRLVVRKPRKYSIDMDYAASTEHPINAQDVCRVVRIHYYNNAPFIKKEFYPLEPSPAEIKVAAENGETISDDTQVYSVDAGETVTFEIQMSGGLTSVNQPECIEFVEDKKYDNTNGVYAVSGNDGLPITPEQWAAYGGSVSVRISERDPSIVEVTVTGASDDTYAPYSIAMTSGSGNTYNSLHLTGTGVQQSDDFVDIRTGATARTTVEDIGAEVTNPYIRTKGQAYTAGAQVAASKSIQHTMSGTGFNFMPGQQVLGRIGGARVRAFDTIFRVAQATINPGDLSISAEADVLASDFNAHYEGMTAAEFSALWESRTFMDFSISPLRS